MWFLRWIIGVQIVSIVVIAGCLLLLDINLFVAVKTTYQGGPTPFDPIFLDSKRRINVPEVLPNDNFTSLIPNDVLASRRFIFMSCNRQRMFNPFWSVISALEPNVITWMGDVIYADHTGSQIEVAFSIIKNLVFHPIGTLRALILRSQPLFPPAHPSVILNAYEQTLHSAGYRSVLSGKQLELVTGTYDDHDFGVNDGDKTFLYRDFSKKLLLDFLNVSFHDTRRSSSHPGVYGVEYLNIPFPDGHGTAMKVAIILLDTRYNKDNWASVDPQEGDFLGSIQWAWLESLLENSTADIHLIISSIQVLVESRAFLESWSGFPRARHRLLNTVLRSGAKNPVFLSGDVHFAEISTVVCHPKSIGRDPDSVDLPTEVQLWEFSSSGMTHSARHMVVTGGYIDLVVRWLLPTDHTDTRSDGLKQMYTGRNIGILDVILRPNIQSSSVSSILSFKILNSLSQIVLSKDLFVSFKSNWLSTSTQVARSNSSKPFIISQKWKSFDWNCFPLTGPVSIQRARLGVQLVIISSVAFGLFLLFLILLPLYLVMTCKYFRKSKQVATKKPKQD